MALETHKSAQEEADHHAGDAGQEQGPRWALFCHVRAAGHLAQGLMPADLGSCPGPIPSWPCKLGVSVSLKTELLIFFKSQFCQSVNGNILIL